MLYRSTLAVVALLLGGCEVVFPLDATSPAGPIPFTPSNEVELASLTGVDASLALADATIDSDTGEITGAFQRPAGIGVIAGVGYSRLTSPIPDVAVFAFAELALTGRVRVVGDSAVVFLIGTDVTLDAAAVLDGAAGCEDPTDTRCGGPGGGDGHPAVGTECDGADGGRPDNTTNDVGGGGGGGSTEGASSGGAGTASGAAGGVACTSARPLRGGGGGGYGSADLAMFGVGGGGGGALQITALGTLRVDGAITVGGGGGQPGPSSADAGAGGGGGGGGAILLEAARVELGSSSVLAANGGGGAGGSGNAVIGGAGQSGLVSDQPAAGGSSPDGEVGGNGGALVPPTSSRASGNNNTGGAGGAAGAILIRSVVPAEVRGSVSPLAATALITE